MTATNCNLRDVSSIVMNPEVLLEVHAFVCRAELEREEAVSASRSGAIFVVGKTPPSVDCSIKLHLCAQNNKPDSET